MSIISLPYTFTAGATIVAAQFNSNFQTIYNDYNGNVTGANISSGATFPDSVLQQIQTAGKVNGSALTLLANIPSGAGFLPTANLGSGTANSTTFLRGDQTYASPWPAYIKATNTQAQNTGGGAGTTGSWQTSTLNTKDFDTASIATLNTNVLTLPSGTYQVDVLHPFYGGIGGAQARLFNSTTSSALLNGSSGGTISSSVNNFSFVKGQFTIGVSSAIILQYQITTHSGNNDLGAPANFGAEVYATVELWKIA